MANGTAVPTPCPLGRVNPPGSTTPCRNCNYDKYYYNTTTKSCQARTKFCNLETHYEMPTPLNQTQESICVPLAPCNTAQMDTPVSVIVGEP